jgi:hypothetical protein
MWDWPVKPIPVHLSVTSDGVVMWAHDVPVRSRTSHMTSTITLGIRTVRVPKRVKNSFSQSLLFIPISMLFNAVACPPVPRA